MGRLLVILAFCASLVLLFARAPDALTAPQFWAEDATVFWIQQYDGGFFEAVVRPYAGYLHTVPRLIAVIANPFPYATQPAIYVALTALVTAWSTATIAALPLPRWLAFAFALCALLVVPRDSLANPSYVQWIMAPALPLIASTAAPSRSIARHNQIVFVALSGLTGPFSILMAPIWLYRAVVHRNDTFDRVLARTGLATGVVQFLALLCGAEVTSARSAGFGTIVETLAYVRDVPWLLALCGLLLVAALAIVGWSVMWGRLRQQRLACVIFAVLVFGSGVWKFGADWNSILGGRYVHMPVSMALFCAMSLMFERSVARIVGVAGCAVILLAAARQFVRPPIPDFSKEWKAAAPVIGERAIQVPTSPNETLPIPALSELVSARK